jgi:hypothetical protein
MEKTLTVDQAVEAFRVWMDDEFDSPSGSMTDSEEEGLRLRLNAFASLPTLNIGMGEIKESEVLKCCEDYADNYPIEGRITVNRTAMRKALEVFLIAHTKAVTVEAIVKLAEEWDAYRVVTPTDPDGIEDFRARLLKLIQE